MADLMALDADGVRYKATDETLADQEVKWAEL